MDNREISAAFASLSTPLVADAGLRLRVPLAAAPDGIRPVLPGLRAAGRVAPARHFGSVDVFLEALGRAASGDLLVIDNGGRSDEACIGDLTVLETRAAGLSGVILWGRHRDTLELVEIAFPVFSYGRTPFGPQRLDPRTPDALSSARFGESVIDPSWVGFADDDGVLFAPADSVPRLLDAAGSIHAAERRQADRVRAGETLRSQFRFDEFLARRAREPERTFRQHLREIDGAIEV